jgi:sec-independent protein translocase protein TatB
MFGVSFGELTLLVLLAIVLIGPRNMPDMMRKLGRTITKVRRVATDLRQQSGIDEILQNEGIQREVQELQKLASGRIMDLGVDLEAPMRPRTEPTTRRNPPRNREYPTEGADCFDALPDDAEPYRADDRLSNGEPPAGEVAASSEPAAAELTVSRAAPTGAIPRGAAYEEAAKA